LILLNFEYWRIYQAKSLVRTTPLTITQVEYTNCTLQYS